jgi:OOP family OmpA-OmpF porin
MSGLDSVFGATQTSTEAATVFAAARGIVPIGDDFAVFGKAGLHAWVADWTLNSSLVPLRDDANGVSFLFGLGASVSVGRMVEIRGEWERFADIGDVAHTDEFDADLLSVGVLLKF